ncbi:MAG: hypothetical protein RSA91_07875 [Bacilli bacterium]
MTKNHLDSIKNENLKSDIIFCLNQNEELSKIIELQKEFKVNIFSKNPDLIYNWLEKAKKLNIKEINSFVNLIESV